MQCNGCAGDERWSLLVNTSQQRWSTPCIANPLQCLMNHPLIWCKSIANNGGYFTDKLLKHSTLLCIITLCLELKNLSPTPTPNRIYSQNRDIYIYKRCLLCLWLPSLPCLIDTNLWLLTAWKLAWGRNGDEDESWQICDHYQWWCWWGW